MELPIACELSEPERRKRKAEIQKLLRHKAKSISERPAGIEVRFAGRADVLGEVAELMSIERRCCRFLRFELTAEPQEGPIQLAITGPEGTTEFLRSWYA